MSDKLTGCDLETLTRWILAEEESGFIFGIHRDLFFQPAPSDSFRLQRYGQTLETPIGVAAGPHSQLSQNIIKFCLCDACAIFLGYGHLLDSECSKAV